MTMTPLPTVTPRLIGVVGLALAAALTLGGCAAASSIATETVRGVAPGVQLTDEEQLGDQPVAVWSADRTTVTVVTWGSSSCPPVPTSLTLPSAMLLDLRFAPPGEGACTADFAPTSHVFTTPDGISFSAVQMQITFEARSGGDPVEVTIPVRDPE